MTSRGQEAAGESTSKSVDDSCTSRETDRINLNRSAQSLENLNESTPTYECWYRCCWESCNYSTNIRRVFKAHLQTHMIKKPYTCPNVGCAFTSNEKLPLALHILSHAITPPLRCCALECKYTCYRQSDMLRHVETTHTKNLSRSDRKSFGFSPTTSSAFLDPQRKHTAGQAYCCPWPDCHFECLRKKDLRNHLQEWHSGRFPGEEDFRKQQCRCPQCLRKYKDRKTRKLSDVGGPALHNILRGGQLSFIKMVTIPRSQLNQNAELPPTMGHTGLEKPEDSFRTTSDLIDSATLKRSYASSAMHEQSMGKAKIQNQLKGPESSLVSKSDPPTVSESKKPMNFARRKSK